MLAGEVSLAADIDAAWVLECFIIVWMMQAGFSFLEAGHVRSCNVQNIVFKNLGDCCLGAICWWVSGFAIAYGADPSRDRNAFAGNADFFLVSHGEVSALPKWLLSYAYMTTAGTIVSGAVAERVSLEAYYLLIIVIAAWSYPVAVHWVWSSDGWLAPTHADKVCGNNVIDFSGSGVIHLTGGVGATVAAIVIGPRKLADGVCVFSEAGRKAVSPHNRFAAAIGTLLLWFSWFAFNAGSVFSFASSPQVASNACVTTALAGSAATLTGLAVSRLQKGHVDLADVCNAGLGGLVAITAGCAHVAPEWSIVIGFVAALAKFGWAGLRRKLRIDDVVDAGAVHGVCGAWGMIAVGLFADRGRIEASYGATSHYGLLLGGGGEQLAVQLLAVVVLSAWAAAWMLLSCMCLKWTVGLRVPLAWEIKGLDLSEHKSAGLDTAPNEDGIDASFELQAADAGVTPAPRRWQSPAVLALYLVVAAALPHAVRDAGSQNEPGPSADPPGADVPANVTAVAAAVSDGWTLFCFVYIFFMQAGFCFLEAGCVRSVNIQSIVLKNLSDACLSVLCFMATGYAIAYGRRGAANPVVGEADFFLLTDGEVSMEVYPRFLISCAFMTAAGTIVSGAVADRVNLTAYCMVVAFVYLFSYPVMVHWVWSPEGWLSPRNSDRIAASGLLDFSGSGVIHLSGGVTGAVCAKVIGPRALKDGVSVFSAEGERLIAPHNRFFCAVGALLLFTSWFAFNAGSVNSFGGSSAVAATACTNTVLSGASAALTGMLLSKIFVGHLDLGHTLNGTIGGLVGITAGCAYVRIEYSVVIGAVAAFVYFGGWKLRRKLQIDDVVDAGAVHGGCGAWGLIAAGLFADAARVRSATGLADVGEDYGLFIGGSWKQFGVQVLGVVVLTGWAALNAAASLALISRVVPLRVPKEHELMGLDMAEQQSSGYDYIEEMEKQRNAAVASMQLVWDVCDCFVQFDLLRASKALERATHKSDVHRLLRRLLQNLELYKPYLPGALFTSRDSDSDESELEGPRTQQRALPVLRPNTEARYSERSHPAGPEVTIVFTDVESSTKIWEACGDTMGEALSIHNTVLRDSIAGNAGYEVKVIGDAFMVAFDTPEDAVNFSFDAMTGLVEHSSWPAGLMKYPLCKQEVDSAGTVIWRGLRIRIGVHCGPVAIDVNPVTQRADYFGNVVNKAARCESFGVGGMITVTPDVLQTAEAAGLLLDAETLSFGKRQLKGCKDDTELTGLFPKKLSARRERATQVMQQRDKQRMKASKSGLRHRLSRRIGTLVHIRVDLGGMFGTGNVLGKEVLTAMNIVITAVETAAEDTGGATVSINGGSVVVGFNVIRTVKNHMHSAVQFVMAVHDTLAGEPYMSDCLPKIGFASGGVLWGNVGSSQASFTLALSEVCAQASAAASVARHFRARAVFCSNSAASPAADLDASARQSHRPSRSSPESLCTRPLLSVSRQSGDPLVFHELNVSRVPEDSGVGCYALDAPGLTAFTYTYSKAWALAQGDPRSLEGLEALQKAYPSDTVLAEVIETLKDSRCLSALRINLSMGLPLGSRASLWK
eukprot:TRINITY_DN35603_c0_g1_i1.p1 TRINITY_DN35603_c0_g1~~TRINITY_DN35603_c0_g1_i1.p1  ORF type:complete len:1586 (+),score=448.81 TRINITY_DN35603_c0_g1_i1:74-4759(+)